MNCLQMDCHVIASEARQSTLKNRLNPFLRTLFKKVPEALFKVAAFYHDGLGVEKDDKAALVFDPLTDLESIEKRNKAIKTVTAIEIIVGPH